ncbi:endonuclease/exonuclease/phosphatase family protein [Lutibacter sp. B1]|uniref:endonuclease/exonuclease/phosphatase family protein n=1 Tax=Lutibacter sp. B1 TaxID=2725996 RepID=UPI001456C4FE|nr:endonuclease/exonuclease/phosphatase family protein [Lutibacter sp. B1]NLP58408.1 endonuclease/exonuclease/phosphatase family protein [Lutibacter sp. B1]
MKNLSLIDKLLFFINSIVATLLLLSFSGLYISPNTISFLSLISLLVPFLIIINVIFGIYWLLKLKRQFFLSAIVLLLSFYHITKFYRFSEKKVMYTNDVKIMSYNVRMFNIYKWIDKENVDEKIFDFIESKSPDILCIQEFHSDKNIKFNYPYKYINVGKRNRKFGDAIFSKYKIINSGSLNFENTTNNAIFADIVKNNDTIRVYNVHLESLKINPKEETFNKENSEKLRFRLENAFKKQANQVTLIKLHQEKINYKTIICGDFNNTAFSWAYHQLKENKNDAFEEAGNNFGKTYDLKFPFRIDFILTDKQMEIHNFKTYNIPYSDHNPIMARVSFN